MTITYEEPEGFSRIPDMEKEFHEKINPDDAYDLMMLFACDKEDAIISIAKDNSAMRYYEDTLDETIYSFQKEEPDVQIGLPGEFCDGRRYNTLITKDADNQKICVVLFEQNGMFFIGNITYTEEHPLDDEFDTLCCLIESFKAEEDGKKELTFCRREN